MRNHKLNILFGNRVLKLGTEVTSYWQWKYNAAEAAELGILPDYAGSLDASLEGVEKLGLSDPRITLVPVGVVVIRDGKIMVATVTATPVALALVTACLLASGVTQEEINEASS